MNWQWDCILAIILMNVNSLDLKEMSKSMENFYWIDGMEYFLPTNCIFGIFVAALAETNRAL